MKKAHFFHYILFFCILIGIFFRFYNLRYNSQFTWDQENSLAFPAREIIVNHHFPLIGAKTGVGDLYLSPLYSYMAAFFYWIFRLDPIGGAVFAGIVSTLTIGLGYILMKLLFGHRIAFYTAVILSISPFLLSHDRIAWNVNLFPLATMLFFSGLFRLLSKKKEMSGWMLTGIGLFLGLTSHFTVIFLVFLSLFLTVLRREMRNWKSLIPFLFMLLAITPLIVFNFRHDNILLQNATNFFENSINSPTGLFTRVIQIAHLQIKMIGEILLTNTSSWLQTTVGLCFLLYFGLKYHANKLFCLLYGLFFFTYLFGFSIYKGPVPSYYLSGLMLVSVIGWGILVNDLVSCSGKSKVLLLIPAVALLSQSYFRIHFISDQSIGAKQDIVKYIKSDSNNKQFSVLFDMDLGWRFGYDYLFYSEGIENLNVSSSANTYWISYPQSRFPGIADYVNHGIALGVPDTTSKILETKDVEFYSQLLKMRVPKNATIAQCPSIDFDSYIISSEDTVSCSQDTQGMKVFNLPDCSISDWSAIPKIRLKNGMEFTVLTTDEFADQIGLENQEKYIISLEENRCIIFSNSPNNPINKINMESLLETIQLH
jgi:4-amino-4-deoxy-L-arabinose transferase-like glycosyltransferase